MIKIFEADVYSIEIGAVANMLNKQIDEWVDNNPKLEISIQKTELTMHTYKRSKADRFKHIRYILVVHYAT